MPKDRTNANQLTPLKQTKKGVKAGEPTQSQTAGKSGQGGDSAGAAQAAVTFAQSIPSLGSFWLRDI